MTGALKQSFKTMEFALLKSKFRGSLLGALVGDCSGSPYEGQEITAGDKIIIQRYFDRLETPDIEGPIRTYTDDTAMTKSVAIGLIDKSFDQVDYKYMAKLFTDEFYKEPKRGYGANIIDVFKKLRKNRFEDIFTPAKQQFFGSGSFGNGGAMRVAPVALLFHNDQEKMIEVTEHVTKLTHTHRDAVEGAVFQALAISQALNSDPKSKLDVESFCNSLYEKIEKYAYSEKSNPQKVSAYGVQINKLQELLNKEYNDEYDDEVIRILGNDISALDSVPTALFCFLKAQSQIPTVKSENIFRRTIQFAITLGGDTDTIASMAGAIAGAYIGEQGINTNIINYCEFSKEMPKIADDLFETFTKLNANKIK